MDSAVVELRGVTKCYGRLPALARVSLRLEPGVSYGLIGRNGAGKTTLLRLIMGMLHPTLGQVMVFGGDPIEDAERVKRHVGYLAEDHAFPQVLRASDLIRFFAACYPTWDRAFAEALVERFRIPVRRRLGSLSKGEGRQVMLVCAVAHHPRLLVLDEPGGGLDPVVRRQFLEEVIDLLAAEKTTVILSSHHLQEVERVATRVGILHHGELLLEEDLDRLREGSCQALVAGDGLSAEGLRRDVAGLIGARRSGDGWLLTLRQAPEAARERLQALAAGRLLDARPATLEEVFFALVGEEA